MSGMTQLFFDVETTGLIPKGNVPPSDFEKYSKARIVSIAWTLRDENFVYSNHYAIINNEEEGELGGTFIHGITREMVQKFGKPLKEVVQVFLNDMYCSDKLVAHNLAFDSKVLASELYRLGLNNEAKDLLERYSLCTMVSTTNLLKLPSRYGKYKWPKLVELHAFLFGEGFDGQHDASKDVEALVRCYYKLESTSFFN